MRATTGSDKLLGFNREGHEVLMDLITETKLALDKEPYRSPRAIILTKRLWQLRYMKSMVPSVCFTKNWINLGTGYFSLTDTWTDR